MMRNHNVCYKVIMILAALLLCSSLAVAQSDASKKSDTGVAASSTARGTSSDTAKIAKPGKKAPTKFSVEVKQGGSDEPVLVCSDTTSQKSRPMTAIYRLTFQLSEIEDGKVVDAHVFTIEDGNDGGLGQARYAYTRNNSANDQEHLHIGLDSAVCGKVSGLQAVMLSANLSTLLLEGAKKTTETSDAKPAGAMKDDVQLSWKGLVALPLDKKTLVFSSEDSSVEKKGTMTGKREYQLELTISQVK